MVWILDFLVAVVGARVPGDELVLVIDADPIRVCLNRHAHAGVADGNGIAVSVQGDRGIVCTRALWVRPMSYERRTRS